MAPGVEGRQANNCLQSSTFSSESKAVTARRHRPQQVLFAAELALNECRSKNLHTLWPESYEH
jgi:hypothetical protein